MRKFVRGQGIENFNDRHELFTNPSDLKITTRVKFKFFLMSEAILPERKNKQLRKDMANPSIHIITGIVRAIESSKRLLSI